MRLFSDMARFRSALCLPFAVGAFGLIAINNAAAQSGPRHLNPAIEKLAAGKPILGINTTDLSMENARAMARADVDFVYVDMEHGPMDLTALHHFTIGMIDKASILKKGNAQPNVAVFARFAPDAGEHGQWAARQALDIGLMGVMFTGIDDPKDALAAVQNMRYPQKRGAKYPEPVGLRGYYPANALWAWGIPDAEYERRADLWPLNPDGDLLSIMMVESVEGIKNVDAIAAVPGVGAFFLGAGADLSRNLGIDRNSPELEQNFQTILKACVAHNVACGITAQSPSDITKRIREGWKLIRSTEPVLQQWRSSQAGR